MKAKDIYYLELEINYRKFYPNKKTQQPYLKAKQWCVSKYCEPQEIMIKDEKSITSLRDRLFAKTYKGRVQIKVNKVLSQKVIGQTMLMD
jgi:hypothetical protein|tara:strand:- start:259 stop:528 length:270 start_codon:yes stop_codon:yes gene_type:complete